MRSSHGELRARPPGRWGVTSWPNHWIFVLVLLNLPEAAANTLERVIRDLENILRAGRAITLAHNEKASEEKSTGQ